MIINFRGKYFNADHIISISDIEDSTTGKGFRIRVTGDDRVGHLYGEADKIDLEKEHASLRDAFIRACGGRAL